MSLAALAQRLRMVVGVVMNATAVDGWLSADDWQYKELVGTAERAGIPPVKLGPILGSLWPVYYRFDADAAGAQSRFRRGAVAVYSLSGFAVAVAIGQYLFLPAFHHLVMLEVAAMVAALALLWMSHHWHWKRLWLETRYTAEQLRIRMYLAIVLPQGAGAPGFGATADPASTLPFYNQLGVKLPAKAEAAMLDRSLANCTVEDVPALKVWVEKGWIASQVRFHRKAAERHRRSARIARRATFGLFALTLVAAILHMSGLGHGAASDEHARNSLLAQLIVFLSIALPAIASAVHAINDLLDHERIVVRSTGMALILDALAREVADAQTLDQVRDLARRTEQMMAIENFEWLAALTFRQPHTP